MAGDPVLIGPGFALHEDRDVRVSRTRALVSVMALTAAVLSGCGDGHATNPVERSHDGPLVIGEPHWWWHEARQGDVFSDGPEILRIHGSEPATIDAVTSHR